MTGSEYVPARGDVVWIHFNPQAGHEQAGRRPAVVLSPYSYNARAGLALICPITSPMKGYPFEVPIPEGLRVSGVILSDQVKSVDWAARGVELADRLPASTCEEVVGKLSLLLAR